MVAGVGVPQLSAVYDVAKALKGTGIPLIADGGLRYSCLLYTSAVVNHCYIILGKNIQRRIVEIVITV